MDACRKVNGLYGPHGGKLGSMVRFCADGGFGEYGIPSWLLPLEDPPDPGRCKDDERWTVQVTPPPACDIGGCNCSLATAKSCATDDGTACNRACCCRFRRGAKAATDAPGEVHSAEERAPHLIGF